MIEVSFRSGDIPETSLKRISKEGNFKKKGIPKGSSEETRERTPEGTLKETSIEIRTRTTSEISEEILEGTSRFPITISEKTAGKLPKFLEGSRVVLLEKSPEESSKEFLGEFQKELQDGTPFGI